MTNGGFTPLIGINLNSGITTTKKIIEEAKESGAHFVRGEEKSSNNASLANVAKWALEVGVKLCWITYLIAPGEKNSTSKKTLVEQINELSEAQRNNIICIEHGNEFWPGGVFASDGVSGKAMGELYVGVAKELVTAGITIPFGMEVQTSGISGANTWTEEELKSVTAAELKTALIGTGTEAKPNNRLVSHPYMGKMTAPLLEPNNPKAYKSGAANGSKEWCSQRWMAQQLWVKEITGLIVPMVISEYGVRVGGTEVADQENNVLTRAEQVEYVEAVFSFITKVDKGEVAEGAEAPTGMEPVLAALGWFTLYNGGGNETYGLRTEAGAKITEDGLAEKFIEGANKLVQLRQSFTVSLTPTVTLKRALIRALTPSLKPGVMLGRTITHRLSASMSPQALLTHRVVQFLMASLGFSGSVNRRVGKQLAASLQPLGVLKNSFAFTHRFVASLSPSGDLLMATIHRFVSSLNPRVSFLVSQRENLSPPAISGPARLGEVEFETHGSWTHTPTAYEYQWYRCNETGEAAVAIEGANRKSYVPVLQDVGHTLRVAEIALDETGPSSPAFSPATTVVTTADIELQAPAIDEPVLKWPFRMAEDESHIPFIEQDTAEEYEQSVALVLTTRPGGFPDEVNFGFPDPTFSEGGVAAADLAAAVRKWEPRAHLYFTLDELIGFAQEVGIQVKS